MELKTEYKGYEVKWEDYSRDFSLTINGSKVKTGVRTLEDCEKWIDAKLKQKYKRIPVIVRERWGGGKKIEGEATSVIDDKYIWVVAKNGERSKVAASDTWLLTPANVEALKQIKAKEGEIAKLQEEINTLSTNAERITIAMMIEPEPPK